MSDEPFMIPCIHLNGDTKGTLLEQCEAAHTALYKAIEAVAGMSPNGRNYYPKGPDAIYAAQRQHAARLARLESVKREIEAIWEAIDEIPGR